MLYLMILSILNIVFSSGFKGCVYYIYASLFFKSKPKHLSNQEKCFLFHFKSSFPSRENQMLEFYNVKFHDVIKCLMKFDEMKFVNEIWPVCVILQKKKFYQKFLQKLRPENQFQAFQRMKITCIGNLKQATYVRFIIANLSKFVQISILSSTEYFLRRIL